MKKERFPFRSKGGMLGLSSHTPAPVYWNGNTTCQVCNVKDPLFLVDGKLRDGGQWAVMCIPCHNTYGIGLGTGKGQMYQKTTNSKYVKMKQEE